MRFFLFILPLLGECVSIAPDPQKCLVTDRLAQVEHPHKKWKISEIAGSKIKGGLLNFVPVIIIRSLFYKWTKY